MICKAHEIDGVIISAQYLNGHSTSDTYFLKYKKVHFYHKI